MITTGSGSVADRLTVTAAQPVVVDREVAVNVEEHAATVRAATARVVVFPELSLTGYRLDAAAVDPDDPALSPLVVACAATGRLALVGAPTTSPCGDHLSVLAVDGDGVSVAYHKLYLGDDERDRFQPGPGPAVVEVDGWRLGLAVCKDTGVTEHAERTAALGIDAYLAGVCEHGADTAIIEQRARRIAIDHRVPVVVASFAGSTGHGYDPAAGTSGVWDADGAEVARAGAAAGDAVAATLLRRAWPSRSRPS